MSRRDDAGLNFDGDHDHTSYRRDDARAWGAADRDEKRGDEWMERLDDTLYRVFRDDDDQSWK